MADILCKLKLVTDNYDKNLKKSKQQMQDFDRGVGIAKSGMIKFLGVLGAGVTVGEAYNKWMRSSQTTADEFDNTVFAAKGSVDAFFTSLNTGNWDVFSDGILTAFGRLKDLSALMDTIADMKLSLGYIKAEDLRNIEEYEARARDTTLSTKERKEALEGMKAQIKDLNTNTETYINASTEGLVESYKANYGIDISPDEIKTFARVTNFSEPEMMKKVDAYKKGLEDLQKSFTVTTQVQSVAGTSVMQSMKPGYDEAVENYKKQNDFIRKQVVLLDEVDDRRKAMIDTLIENLGLEQQIESLNKRANRLNNSLSKDKGSTKTEKAEKETPVAGSIDYINAQVSELTKRLGAETDGAMRVGLKMAIDKFNKEKHSLELYAEVSAPLSGKKVEGKKASDAADVKLTPIANKVKPVISAKDVKVTDQYNASLDHTLSMMLAIGNATNEGAAGWVTYGVNSLTALNSTYQALAAVIPALQVKAIVAGAASAAETPIIGWITAIAAIGAMTAAFATLPKYETGGIVGANGGMIPGASFSGDKVLARVNSGELILNRAQQKNIASQLVAGGSTSRIDVNVMGRISGRDIDIVMDKRSQFKNRTR